MHSVTKNATNWLTDELKKEIKAVFEPRYQRKLTDEKIVTIANNLTEVMEAFLKMKWREKYENQKT